MSTTPLYVYLHPLVLSFESTMYLRNFYAIPNFSGVGGEALSVCSLNMTVHSSPYAQG